MTNTIAPVSWNQLASFGGDVTNEATAFSDNVGGGAYYDLGVHKDVTIEVVEPKKSASGNFYVKLTLTNDDGAKINTNIMLMPGKDGKGYHFTYTRLAAAVIGDAELRMRFFKAAAGNPQLLDALRGIKVSATIVKGKEGYVIEENALGAKVPIDVATGAEYPEFKGRVFTDYTDIKDACKEYSIKRMYNEVGNVTKPSEEALAANEQALSEVLRASEAPAAGKAPTASRAARPTRTL